jgi:hypothetical protein
LLQCVLMNEGVLLSNVLFLRNQRLTKIPKVIGAGHDTLVEASTMKTAAAAGTAQGDAQAEVSAALMAAADVAVICHEAEIPQQPEV